MAIARFTPDEIRRSVRFDPLTKKGSVIDVIRLVTGSSAKNAADTFQRMQAQYPEVTADVSADVSGSVVPVTYMKFPGQGQRPTPVALLKDLVEIAWLCPGKHAAEFRQSGAVMLCRALGGDPALVEDIRARRGTVSVEAQEALLEGTGVTVAEANAQAVVDPEEERLRKRERLADLMLKEVDAQTKMLKVYNDMKAQAALEEDERVRLFFADAARNYAWTHFEAPGYAQLKDASEPCNPNVQITIQEVLRDMGLRLPRGEETKVGREAAMLYRNKYGGSPPKCKRFVDGAMLWVNCYFEKDRELLEQAIRAVVQQA